MNVYAWPTSWLVENCSIRLEPNVRAASSQYSKAYTSIDLIGEAFVMSVRIVPANILEGGAREAFLNKLRGVHLISAWHFVRPQPIGTQRGAPTLATDMLQGSSVLPLANLTNGATLKAGDMLGVGGQLFQIADDVTISGTTANVNVANRARADLTTGSAVTWDKPTANWRLGSIVDVSYHDVIVESIDIDLIQTW